MNISLVILLSTTVFLFCHSYYSHIIIICIFKKQFLIIIFHWFDYPVILSVQYPHWLVQYTQDTSVDQKMSNWRTTPGTTVVGKKKNKNAFLSSVFSFGKYICSFDIHNAYKQLSFVLCFVYPGFWTIWELTRDQREMSHYHCNAQYVLDVLRVWYPTYNTGTACWYKVTG